MNRRVKAALFALCLFSVSTPVAQGWESQAIGGGGGTPFDFPCGGDAYAIGVHVQHGAMLDAIGLICARWDGTQFYAPERGALFGGSGGSPAEAVCGPGQALAGWRVQQARREESNIALLAPFCRSVTVPTGTTYPRFGRSEFGTTASRPPVFRSWGSDPVNLVCPDGMLMTGIYGRYGELVDRLGFICGVAPAPPSPQYNVDTAIDPSDMAREPPPRQYEPSTTPPPIGSRVRRP
jgi:hypothetical protein